MNIVITGIGLWARGLRSYDMLRDVICGAAPADDSFVQPKPEAIASRERRRAGLMINLAVMAAHQACEHAQVDKSAVPSVFVSAMGDTDITDYMCRKLTQTEKLLSPTKFHNSVHNAPSGYWSISAQNRAPSTFVGGYLHSFGAGLLEAASQAQAARTPVLLVAYDIANQDPFNSVTPVDESFACALVLAPAATAVSGRLQVAAEMSLCSAPVVPESSEITLLNSLSAANPAACGLVLLERIVRIQERHTEQEHLKVAASPHMAMHVMLTKHPQ
jgi:hypothetical protein